MIPQNRVSLLRLCSIVAIFNPFLAFFRLADMFCQTRSLLFAEVSDLESQFQIAE